MSDTVMLEKFLEEYNSLKKENASLNEKIEKIQSEQDKEFRKEKDQVRKLMDEQKKYQKQLRDCKQELQNYETTLMVKDNEIKDLKRRLELKSIIDDKVKDRDNNLFVKFLGRKPVSTNSSDQKLINILNHYENHREKLENELSSLRKEISSNRSSDSALRSTLDRNTLHESNDLVRLKKDYARILEQNNQLVNTNLEIKKLYGETRKELIQSFNIIQGLNQQQQPIKTLNCELKSEYGSTNNYKTGTFEQEGGHLCEESFSNKENILSNANKQQPKANKCIQKLFQIFQVNTELELVQAAEKVELVMMGVQKLEIFCRSIFELVQTETSDFEFVYNTIFKWKNEMKYIDSFLAFKKQLEKMLNLGQATDQMILESIDALTNNNNEMDDLRKLFSINTDENFMFKMNQICVLLQDISKFIKLAKRMLELDENMRNEQVLSYVLKLIEKTKLSAYNDPDLLWKILRVIHVEHPGQIVQKLEKLMQR